MERKVVRECLRAVVEGSFFPDWEFGTLFGVEQEKAKEVLRTWPNVEEEYEVVSLVLNNAMNNLLGYPHESENVWHEHISVSPGEIARIFKKWRQVNSRR